MSTAVFRAQKQWIPEPGAGIHFMNTNMKGTSMDEIEEIENTMARCMEASSIPQSNPAAARVSEMVTRYIQKFDSVRLQIFRLSGISNEDLRSYLNALRITLLRKGVQPQYCWQYNPSQDAYLLFLCHSICNRIVLQPLSVQYQSWLCFCPFRMSFNLWYG